MILILIGRSGSGKTAVMKRLVNHYGYVQVKTCTTRDRRPGEEPDAYHFMSKEEFRKHMAEGGFVETDVYRDNLYGMLKSSLTEGEKLVAVLTPDGAEAVKKIMPDTYVANIAVDMKTAVMRVISREEGLDPGRMHTISVQANQDYYLYKDPACDGEFPNPDGTKIWDLADAIETAHGRYEFSRLMKDTTQVLRESAQELRAYDEKKKLPITFRLYQSVRFDRPIDREKHHISPGGYEVVMQCEDGTEKSVRFDFEDYEGGVSDRDTNVVEMMQKNPDWGSYEELKDVTEYMLRHIVAVKEWFIYTGEDGPVPVEVMDPEIELISDGMGKEYGPDKRKIPITVPIPLE